MTLCRFLASLTSCRFLARCLSSSLSASSFCLFSDLSAVALRFAHRELHERRGKTVRKLDHRYCHIVVRLCFCTRHVLAPNSRESFSAGLCRAKITEICAKWCPCPQVSRRLPPPLADREAPRTWHCVCIEYCNTLPCPSFILTDNNCPIVDAFDNFIVVHIKSIVIWFTLQQLLMTQQMRENIAK